MDEGGQTPSRREREFEMKEIRRERNQKIRRENERSRKDVVTHNNR